MSTPTTPPSPMDFPAQPADAAAGQGVSVAAENGRIILRGVLDATSVPDVRRSVNQIEKGKRRIDIAGLTELDTAGSLLLCAWQDHGDTLTGVRPEHKRLLKLVAGLDRKPAPPAQRASRVYHFIAGIGRAAADTWQDFVDFVNFTGRTAATVLQLVLHPADIRPSAIAHHINETGVKALPIVGLLAVMIAVVIAYQGVAQLRPYGGQDLTIDLVSVSVLREMAVLITAILVAGRSGAAFAAEIGVMKSSEEIDALKVMGLDPMQLLVAPRLIALVLTLPLLTFFADVLGLLGGAVISNSLLGVSLQQYLPRVRDAVDSGDLFVGLFKAPVFAAVITITGCMHGLRVKGSAESVGEETTRAVVKSIFLVIVLDALFSIVFERVGI